MTDEFISLGIDYLGFLNAQLRDLRGYRTLANELIQNAEDPGATTIEFDVREDALVVHNNGLFSDCGSAKREVCTLEASKGHLCDFHRFRRTASGDKRREANTIGAFGIGFVSVYQVTDRPELISNGQHWCVRPEESEDKRIQVLGETESLDGTRFVLPWAKTQSKLRTALRVEPVPEDIAERFCDELMASLPQAILFLTNIETIKLKREGKLMLQVDRRQGNEPDELEVTANSEVQKWQLLHGEFSREAQLIKSQPGSPVEAKRKSGVTIALPIGGHAWHGKGLFFATLPTEHVHGLPFHLNADFFPSTDRKRVLFDDDFQGKWNKTAVQAAASTLAANMEFLPEILGPSNLWQLIASAKEAHKAAENSSDGSTAVLKAFWGSLAPGLSEHSIIYTSKGTWRRPNEAFLLLNRGEEETAVELLEALQIHLVHPDLNIHMSLLREKDIGTPVLLARHVAVALARAGLDSPIPFEQAPEWLKISEGMEKLCSEISILLGRNKGSEENKTGRELIAGCAVAKAKDGWLRPPKSLVKGSEDRQLLVPHAVRQSLFLADDNPPLMDELVKYFEISDFIQAISRASREQLTTHWHENPEWPTQVVSWLSQRKDEINRNATILEALRRLPIWPSGEVLRPLSDLTVPGDFQDPLGLADIIDQAILPLGRDFLLGVLHAQCLTLELYASKVVPQAFQKDQEIPPEKRRALVKLLAEQLGRFTDSKSARDGLMKCHLVEGTDGEFGLPQFMYFDSPIVKDTLGDSAHLAHLDANSGAALQGFYKWLGVAALPRPEDVTERIESLVEEAPTKETRESVIRLMVQIGRNWSAFKEESEEFEPLRTLRWLPVTKGEDAWFAPREVYASFQSYLFESQARFLDMPIQHQREITDFFRFLDVESVPSVDQVIRHLLASSERGVEINKQIYAFLTDKSDDLKILQLKNKSVIYIEYGGIAQYVRPDQVFWQPHPFGGYRHTLGADWRTYQPLLSKLGVKENPDSSDAIEVLREISVKFSEFHTALDGSAKEVHERAWELLDKSLCDGSLAQSLDKALGKVDVITNAGSFLRRPDQILFEDRPLIASKFPELLKDCVIPRPIFAWRAMEAAGVTLLSKAIEVSLVECVGELPDPALQQIFAERRSLLDRVLTSRQLPRIVSSLLDELQIYRADRLVINHRLAYSGSVFLSPPEDTPVYYDSTAAILYYTRVKGIPWAAVSRELAYIINPDSEAGQLAAGFKEVLSSPSCEEANASLDDLGYAPLDTVRADGAAACEEVGVGGHVAADSPEIALVGDDSERVAGQESEEPSAVAPTTAGAPSQIHCEAEEAFEDEDYEDDEEEESQSSSGGTAATGHAARGKVRSTARSSKGSMRRPAGGRQGGALRSYVVHEEQAPDEPSDSQGNEDAARIDDAGTNHVLDYEKKEGRVPLRMPHPNKGYDVESTDAAGIVRYIEVKSLNGIWGGMGVGLSVPQYEEGQKRGPAFWLYIVENAVTPEATIIAIQDPVDKITEYRFDDGWRDSAESAKPVRRLSIRDVARLRAERGADTPETDESG